MKPELNDILSLLAATIFADKRVYSSEIRAFIETASGLSSVKELDPKVSEAKLLVWYEMHKESVSQNLEPSNFQEWFQNVANRLRGVPDKKSLLEAMQIISSADGEVHVSERALIVLLEKCWSVPSPYNL
jgi:uncharacterized tellurite resistance protein B-like protein